MLTRRALFGSAAFAARPRRPNILFVMPDQMRAQALGCMGNTDAATPNIDRLSREGVFFRNTLANSPVCCPARAVLMTGQYCHRNGMVANDLRLREEHTTLAKVLRAEGYRTGFIGKWHLDGGPRMPGHVPPGPRRQGFEYWAANECSHSHFETQYFRDSPEPIPIRRFEAEAWTDLALEFLRGAKSDRRPFFLSVFAGPPHDPYAAPPEYMRRYNAAQIAMRPNWKPGPNVPGRGEIAAYLAAVTAIDDQVGRLLKGLDETGLTEDTIVLFTSDHGDMLGSQGLRLKRKPWEESIRVPGIVRYPKRLKARESDALFAHIDMPPTLLRLCGIDVPREFQGTDIFGRGKPPDSAYFQIFGPYEGDGTPAGWRGVRTSRYMYAAFRNKPWVLYDLDTDPYETNNLVDSPLRGELHRRLDEWMARTGDSWKFDWSYPVEDAGRLYKDRAFYTVNDYLATLGPGSQPPKE